MNFDLGFLLQCLVLGLSLGGTVWFGVTVFKGMRKIADDTRQDAAAMKNLRRNTREGEAKQ